MQFLTAFFWNNFFTDFYGTIRNIVCGVDWVCSFFFLLLSSMMRNITTLRYINSLGCLLFVAYGFLLDAWPVAVTNAAIVLINAYYLFINRKDKPAGEKAGK